MMKPMYRTSCLISFILTIELERTFGIEDY